jgi:putative ABC transport system permease protein
MKNLVQDVRFGVRVLAKSPGFTLTAVLTLALGIGANTAMFAVVYGVLLRPLPYPQADRIVQLAETDRGQTDEMTVTAAQLRRLQDFAEPFESIAGYTSVGYNLTSGNSAEHLRGMPVSPAYFRVLGVQPALGRDFAPEDDAGEGQRVAIISHNLWTRRFGGEASAIGKKILLNGEPYILIGVMPRDFLPLAVATDMPNSGAADIWVPLALVAKTVGSGENIGVLARRKLGVTTAQLRAQMALVTETFRREHPEDVGKQTEMSFEPYQAMIGAEVRPYLLLLLGAIGFVLLIACANVANLFLARGGLRAREMALRVVLGASRSRLFQHLITESLLVALAGGGLGLLLAYFGLDWLLALAPIDLPRAANVHLDLGVFVFGFLTSLGTGLLFGLAPAWAASQTSLNETLKEGVGRASASRGQARIRKALVVGQFAVSLVLLIGSGLMIATMAKLLRADPGFNPHRMLAVQFWLTGSRYDATEKIAAFQQALVRRLEAIPGVDAAAVISAGLPLERGGRRSGRFAADAEKQYFADYREITPGFFAAMGVPLKQGRFFNDADAAASSKVVIVNEAFARKYFSGGSAIGQNIFTGDSPARVVGVVADVKSFLDQPAPPTTFIPAAQAVYSLSAFFESWFPRSVMVRSKVAPLSLSRAVREAMASVDPLVPAGAIRSMDQVLSRSLALQDFLMQLLSLFAGLALALASVGIYGVISYAVSQRTREIGVRMALGANPNGVLRLILGEGLKLVAVSAVLGVLAALAGSSLLANILYGVSPTDPVIFSAVVVTLMAVALAACYVPARRAMRVDPVVALRHE